MVVQLWPGSEPVRANDRRDRGMIESAVARPFHSAFRQDAYPTLVEKAAALFHSLISNHPFHDGNKRTAVLALAFSWWPTAIVACSETPPCTAWRSKLLLTENEDVRMRRRFR